MSYDVHFDPCRADDGPKEAQAVSDVLTRAGASPADARGCRAVRFEDGGSAEIYGKDLGRGCMVALRGISPAVARLLFDVMVAGRWVLKPGDETAFVVAASQVPTPEGYERVVVASSGEEVAALLAGGVAAWKKFRDEAVGEDTERLQVSSLFPTPGSKE
jgi:hypothetical protein